MSSFLIADDSREKILFLRHMLKCVSWRGELVIAETTEEAKRLIDTHDISHAFVDFYIPSENGPAVIAYLKKKNPNARIALVSSADSAKNNALATKAGAEATICTTYQSDVVEKTVQDRLTEWQSA